MKGDEDVAHIGIRLDEREKDQITELAQKKDLTLSQIVRKLLRDYLNKEDEKGWENELKRKKQNLKKNGCRLKRCSSKFWQWLFYLRIII